MTDSEFKYSDSETIFEISIPFSERFVDSFSRILGLSSGAKPLIVDKSVFSGTSLPSAIF